MSAHESSPELLTLHALRLLGYADPSRVAHRSGLAVTEVRELLLDLEAFGYVARSEFGGLTGWSVTERGRAQHSAALAAELAALGAREAVLAAHAGFVPLNAEVLRHITDWQLHRLPDGRTIPNRHDDPVADERILRALGDIHRRLAPLLVPVTERLARLRGYAERFEQSLRAAELGDPAWIDAVGRDSAHTVWMQLHQDLLLTLGLRREDGA